MLKKFFNSLIGIKEEENDKESVENEQDVLDKDKGSDENPDASIEEEAEKTDEDAEKSMDQDQESFTEDNPEIEVYTEADIQEDAASDIKEDLGLDIDDIEILTLQEDQMNSEAISENIESALDADDISAIETQTISEIHMEEATEIIEEIKDETADEAALTEKPSIGLFARLRQGLEKTTQNITGRLDELFKGHIEIDDDLYEEIEEILITGDVGFETTLKIIDNLKANIKKKSIQNTSEVREELKNVIQELLTLDNGSLNVDNPPVILVIIGVNGVGKTTSIGKLALRLKNEGKSVLLAAADTFRAAAAEQLEVWANRAEVDIVMHQEGSDPSAVIFDAIKSAKSKKTDVLICDTAGRLHNKKNLMQELSKIFRIIDREYPEAFKEVLIVIDATTGQNAISQVKLFKEAAPVTGVILTKLDGTAKGGVVLSIASEQQLPIKLIGVGEKIEDLQDFDPKDFAEALFSKQD